VGEDGVRLGEATTWIVRVALDDGLRRYALPLRDAPRRMMRSTIRPSVARCGR